MLTPYTMLDPDRYDPDGNERVPDDAEATYRADRVLTAASEAMRPATADEARYGYTAAQEAEGARYVLQPWGPRA